uniref:Keratinocyte associated protein 3 n=1 Tax=Anser brachyrhynchus TaxID=132585 RepID=A0A8B9I3X3_9AVES
MCFREGKKMFPRRLMLAGLGLIVLGHGSLVLGAIVHGSVLRHVARASRAVTPEYAVDLSLQSITAGIVHWTLLSVSLLNCLLSTACSVGLALAIALTVHSRGMRLVTGCNSSALPADARAAIATNDCPFNTTRIYVSIWGQCSWCVSLSSCLVCSPLFTQGFIVTVTYQGGVCMFSNQVEAKEAWPGSCVRSWTLHPLTNRSTSVLRHMFIGDRSGGS